MSATWPGTISTSTGRRRQRPQLSSRANYPLTRSSLPVESRHQECLSQDMAVHGVHDGGACGGRLLRRSLRDLELGVQRIQLEGVVMVRAGRRAWAHVCVAPQAHLTAAIRKLAGSDTFGETGGRTRNV